MSYQTTLTWITKMSFQAKTQDHKIILDAKTSVGGNNLGMNPKELTLQAMCGCTAMDVISILSNKYKFPVKSFEIVASAETNDKGHPKVFTQVHLNFLLNGDVPSEKVVEAVDLSMQKYCGVTAMIAKACPIFYNVELNGQPIHKGQAFTTESTT